MLLALLLSLSLADPALTGVVMDTTGAAISGASVVVQTAAGVDQQTVTGPDGRFAFDRTPSADALLIVRAGGFGEARQPVGASGEIEVVLSPAGLLETVIVTAGRREQRLGDTPASVSLITAEQIQSSPAVVADDVLRQLPSFSLFRRASSLAAQPTTQGVSLRGIGPSGQSRTLVLLDGIPFNDPFGGWVYWTRVPMVSVERIEVTEDTASSLYGNYAMGGVINIVTSRPTRRTLEMKPQVGSRNTPKLDFFASHAWDTLGVAVEGSFLNSDGFPTVTTEAGPIDNNAFVHFRNITGKVEYAATDRVNAFFRAGYFTENRGNGKVGEVNDTRWTTANGGVRIRMPDESDLQSRLFIDHQNAHFNFLAVTNAATTRNLVRLATDQRVPTNGLGGMVQWNKAIRSSHAFTAGLDWRWVDGDSQEDAYVAAVPTVIESDGVTQRAALSLKRISGGTQQSQGLFLQDVFTPVSHMVVTLAGRVDHWRNYDGHNLETSAATGQPTANYRATLPDRTDTVFSPRLGVLYHVTDRVTTWGAINSGFRAPTLTELYRQFSVGAVTTRPNDQLGPERLVGGELGLNVAPAKNLTARVTWFDNRIKNPVSNVTLTPTLAQKRNLGRTRVRGVQTDVEYVVNRDWRVSAAYIYNEAKVTDGGANTALVGKYLAQVPKSRGSFQVAYTNAKIANVSLSVQMIGRQFNDDLNINFIPVATLSAAGYDAVACVASQPDTCGLPGYGSVDLVASRDLGRNLQAFVGVQNLTDKVYFVQTNPSTVGTPRLVTGGLRVRWAGK
jgi:outer membrane receptor protein involved in Fe transport